MPKFNIEDFKKEIELLLKGAPEPPKSLMQRIVEESKKVKRG